MAETGNRRQEQRRHPIEHTGEGGELFLIFIVNWILTVLTLGVYSFWGKTRVRRYLWAHTQFDGEPFEYTGRGIELFLGAMIVGGFFGLLYVGFNLLLETLLLTEPGLGFVVFCAFLALLFFLFGVAEIRRRIYQFSRTQWRGVAMSLDASSFGYPTGIFFLRLLNFLCLGFLGPVIDVYRMRRFIGCVRFGSGAVRTEYRADQLYASFLIFYVLALVGFFGPVGMFALANYETIMLLGDGMALNPEGAAEQMSGLPVTLYFALFATYVTAVALATLASLYYESRKYAHIVKQTRFEGLRFAFVATYKDWAWLYFGNLLLIVFTLGIGYPLVIMRRVRFAVENLQCDGQIDYAKIVHVVRKEPGPGEGLAEAFDLGGI